MTRPLIFVSCPYTDPDPAVVRYRIAEFCKFTAAIERAGKFHAVSALYNQLLLDHDEKLPSTWDFWKSYAYSLIEKSAGLTVVKLDGWERSEGVNDEMLFAVSRGVPLI